MAGRPVLCWARKEGMRLRFEEGLKSAVEYLEDHLDGDIDLDVAARKACCSAYHFQRMFSTIVGMPVSEYVRRRRMTLAAVALQGGPVRIVDLAVRYGYESQSSFARAFQAYHGITPTAAREAGAALKATPRISFQIIVTGAKEMDYRIQNTQPFTLFGVAIPLLPEETHTDAIFDRLGLYADEVMENGTHDATNRAAGQPAGTLLTGVRFDFQPDGACRFMFAAPLPAQGVGDEFTVLDVPAATWAVFDHEQVVYPQTHEALYREIYAQWFPTTAYEQAPGPCLERFPQGKTEIWIPIQRKA